MSRVLVVEDEQHIADGLRFNLEAEGYHVRVVETGEAALDLLSRVPPEFDVVVLDVMLPGKDGFTVMRELRHAGQFIPTLILTARGHSDDILKGFDAGADDYLTKPFDLAILIARLRGLLRRHAWLRASVNHAAAPPAPDDTFTFGSKSVHFDMLELRVGERVFPLTQMEANVLRYLIRHEGKPVSRKTMLEEVWGVREDTDTRPIDNFIVRLRRYVEDDPRHPASAHGARSGLPLRARALSDRLHFSHHRISQLAYALDIDHAFVAGLQPARRLAAEPDAGGSAGRDDVARLQCKDARQKCDQLRHLEDQLAGVRILEDLAVDRHANGERMRVRDLVFGSDRGAHGAERVEGLAHDPLRRRHLEIARATSFTQV